MIIDLKKHSIYRKSVALLNQIPRSLRRMKSKKCDYLNWPTILANSFPKSGTHLLLQIVEALPGVKNYGTFIASQPSITFRERSEQSHLRLIRNIVPGEVIPAHLFYSSIYLEELAGKNCLIFFVYRDLRDVAISEAYYLTYMNPYHRMHNYFAKKCLDMGERISTAIVGVSDPGFPYDYPNIYQRFLRYKGWIGNQNVFSVRYEDLISNRRTDVIKEMVGFYIEKSKLKVIPDDLIGKLERNIDPSSSHTFRKGKSAGWKQEFSDLHKHQMKEVAGNLLIELGYEKDLDW